MNRRQLLLGIAATVAAVRIPDLGSFIPKRFRPKSFLYVVPTQKQAYALYNELGRPKNVKVIPTGGMICGYGADLIIMDENWRRSFDSYVYQEYLDNWYRSTIMTRLYPGGRIVTKRLVV